jgi:hypothetical protein
MEVQIVELRIARLGVEGGNEGMGSATTFMKMTKYRSMESGVKRYRDK